MHPQTIQAKQNRPTLVRVPLFEMLAVQGSKTISLGVEKPPRIPDVAFKLILDAHNRSIRDGQLGIPPARRLGTSLLRRLASLRAPTWEQDNDPVLWVLRVRRNLREAALSHARLQSGVYPPQTDPTQEWSAFKSVRIATMAAWAYRCWDRDERLDSILRQLFNEGICHQEYTVPDYATGHRCLWFIQARGASRCDGWAILADAGILPTWRTQVPPRRLLSEALQSRGETGWRAAYAAAS